MQTTKPYRCYFTLLVSQDRALTNLRQLLSRGIRIRIRLQKVRGGKRKKNGSEWGEQGGREGLEDRKKELGVVWQQNIERNEHHITGKQSEFLKVMLNLILYFSSKFCGIGQIYVNGDLAPNMVRSVTSLIIKNCFKHSTRLFLSTEGGVYLHTFCSNYRSSI